MSPGVFLGLSVAVFCSTAILDAAWVCCVTAVGEEKALLSGAWSAACCTISLVALLSITRLDPWLAIPEIAGAFVGASSMVAYRRRHKRLTS